MGRGTADNLLDLRKIHIRLDKSEYGGFMELVSDVQLMLKSSMLYFGFSYEVRSEATKVHDLFFDLLGVAFSDTDFQDARNALSFSASVSTQATDPSSRQMPAGQSRRQKLVKDVDSAKGPFHKPQSRLLIHTGESTKVRSDVTPKESRLGSNNSRELNQPDDARAFPHPGDLAAKRRGKTGRSQFLGLGMDWEVLCHLLASVAESRVQGRFHVPRILGQANTAGVPFLLKGTAVALLDGRIL